MKYTPMELLAFVKEEHLENDMKTAIGRNTKDYHLYLANGKLLPLNGEMVYDFQLNGAVGPLPLKQYCTPDQIDMLISHPESIRSALVFHGGQISFVFTFSPDKDDEARDEEFWDHVFLNVFTTLGMDTRGKVRAFIQSVPQAADDGGVKIFRPTKPIQ